jgi:hypothetical protein
VDEMVDEMYSENFVVWLECVVACKLVEQKGCYDSP